MLNSIVNFRDFGGYKNNEGKLIKTKMLFRSGSTDKISLADLEELKKLGLKTIIDLRPEKEQKPNGNIKRIQKITLPFDLDGITRTRTKPFFHKKNYEKEMLMAFLSVYKEMPELLIKPVNDFYKILENSDSYPLLINCRAGKDRTGFAVALIQLTLGMSKEDIINDYMISNEFFLASTEKTLRFIKIFTLGIFPVNNLRVIYTAHEICMNAVLAVIENQYGGIKGYLNHCGIKPDQIEKIRNTLLV